MSVTFNGQNEKTHLMNLTGDGESHLLIVIDKELRYGSLNELM